MATPLISPQKETELLARMASLGIFEGDLEEMFVRGSGAGGQKINKTSSCVVIHHRPTGIRVRCQKERSQAQNRFFARRELCDRVEALRTGKVQAQAAAQSKIRRQKARRSRKNKEKMLQGKQQRKGIKQGRKSVSFAD